MRILAETDQAIRSMLQIAGDFPNWVSFRDLENIFKIPRPALIPVVANLNKSNLIVSKKLIGTHLDIMIGEFKIAEALKDINLYDLVSVFEDLDFNHCTTGNQGCVRSSFCPIRPIWQKLRFEAETVLKQHNLENLRYGLDRYKDKGHES